ncbi:hypothetical protein EAF04_000035 [Stromatinia cepivora]|nr:hypothetical protein EAF04_000035 [Stromatinia cepivora]
MLPTLPILQTILFSTLVTSFAVSNPFGKIGAKALALQGECAKQGGLCAHAPCCKNSGLTCRLDGHGMHFCEFGNQNASPSPRSTLDTFHEIFQKFRERASASADLDSYPIPPRHQENGEGGDDVEVVISPNEQGINIKVEDVLPRPYLSLEQTLTSKIDEQTKTGKGNEHKKEEVNKWDFLKVIEMPPRLDDITELPKCKPVNMKCNPIRGIRVCCPELECMQVGPAYEDFECRKAPGDRDEKKVMASSDEEKSDGKLQWFLGGWNNQKSKGSRREGMGRNGESERIDDDEVLSL